MEIRMKFRERGKAESFCDIVTYPPKSLTQLKNLLSFSLGVLRIEIKTKLRQGRRRQKVWIYGWKGRKVSVQKRIANQ